MVYKHTHLSKSLFFSLALVLALACGKSDKQRSEPDGNPDDRPVSLEFDLSRKFQTIENFAASDAWGCQFVGNWPEQKKNAIADLLFSKKLLPDGSPQGIGLSMWRFNIGAGSAEQSDQSGINDEWRRAEGFLKNDGTYDWSKQAGQQWFLKAAKERGVKQFLAFTNSPPVQLTRNGKAFADEGRPNLSPGKFKDFADFLVAVTRNIHSRTGVLFNYLSPANEPQWEWSDGGQEGTPFSNEDISGIVKVLDSALIENKLASKIAVSEAADYKYLYSVADKPEKGDQINAFFNPASGTYIGNLRTVDHLISGHSYFTTSPYSRAETIRKELAAKVASVPGLRLWQSEYCILGDNEGEISGDKRDLGMNAALYLAKVIHNDLVNANVTAWQWWIAVSPYDYKDGLVYVDKNKNDGNYYPSKMLWALGNYSRFIASGARRVAAALSSDSPTLQASSYLDEKAGQLICVIINSGTKSKSVSLKQGDYAFGKVSTYITSTESDLQPGKASDEGIELPARSITTIVAELNRKEK